MAATAPSKMTARGVLDTYFLEARAKLIEIAATLDRVDRAAEAAAVRDDPRREFIVQALGVLMSEEPERARRILEIYSLA